MEITTVILYGFATWRLSSLLIHEAGPWGIFIHIRKWFKIEHYADGTPSSYPDTFFGALFSCIYCMSVWVAGAFFAMHYINYTLTVGFAVILAISASAIMIDRINQTP